MYFLYKYIKVHVSAVRECHLQDSRFRDMKKKSVYETII